LWSEPARDVPVAANPDVLVVGGGAAGVAAAVAAARRGADTWLIEATTGLGGLATLGLIALLLTLDDGAGNQVVGGLCQEVVDRLEARGMAHFPPADQWGSEAADLVDQWRRWGLVWGAPPEAVRYSVAFDPDAFIDVCDELLEEAGVRLRLQTWFAGTEVRDGRVEAVFIESKKGREAIVANTVIDATGDGDVLASAGAQMEQVTIPPHRWFRAGNVSSVAGPAGPGGHQQSPMWFKVPGAAGRFLIPWGPDPERVDACDPDDMTRALRSTRRGARAAFESMKANVPGFEDAWLDDYSSLLGITESRRLVGDYVLTKEDGDVAFPDVIARTGHWTRRHVVYDIPYRCLTAPGLKNVLASGRCISTTRYVHQATKEIPAAMATGEAAGAAAATAADDVHDVDVTTLGLTDS
jgi:hypothetical protein